MRLSQGPRDKNPGLQHLGEKDELQPQPFGMGVGTTPALLPKSAHKQGPVRGCTQHLVSSQGVPLPGEHEDPRDLAQLCSISMGPTYTPTCVTAVPDELPSVPDQRRASYRAPVM